MCDAIFEGRAGRDKEPEQFERFVGCCIQVLPEIRNFRCYSVYFHGITYVVTSRGARGAGCPIFYFRHLNLQPTWFQSVCLYHEKHLVHSYYLGMDTFIREIRETAWEMIDLTRRSIPYADQKTWRRIWVSKILVFIFITSRILCHRKVLGSSDWGVLRSNQWVKAARGWILKQKGGNHSYRFFQIVENSMQYAWREWFEGGYLCYLIEKTRCLFSMLLDDCEPILSTEVLWRP